MPRSQSLDVVCKTPWIKTEMASRNIIELRDLGKVYDLGAVQVPALRGLNFEIEEGSYTAIMGPSGSGKSTLLNILGCLDRPTSGAYLLGGDDVAGMSDKELSRIRGTRMRSRASSCRPCNPRY